MKLDDRGNGRGYLKLSQVTRLVIEDSGLMV